MVENKSVPKTGKKIYISLLKFYIEGEKVNKRTIANLSHCTPEEVANIKLSLKYKK